MKLEECTRRDVNLARLARFMDYQPSYVYAMLSGRRKVSAKFLRQLAKIPLETVLREYISDGNNLFKDS